MLIRLSSWFFSTAFLHLHLRRVRVRTTFELRSRHSRQTFPLHHPILINWFRQLHDLNDSMFRKTFPGKIFTFNKMQTFFRSVLMGMATKLWNLCWIFVVVFVVCYKMLNVLRCWIPHLSGPKNILFNHLNCWKLSIIKDT